MHRSGGHPPEAGSSHPITPHGGRLYPPASAVMVRVRSTSCKEIPASMPILNSIAALADDMAAWRHDFHEHPELMYEVHRTAGIVAERLREFGCDEVVTGIGRTGVVGVIRGRKTGSGRIIGLRADMDALPIEEASGVPYASKTPGLMHACGHDGHTAMLLGAAKHLAETRNF